MKKILYFSATVLLSSFVTFVFTSYACQREMKAEQEKLFSIREAKMEMVYLDFLIHGNSKLLQDYLTDLFKEHIVWLNEIEDSDSYLLDMCPIWEDIEFRNTLKDINTKSVIKVLGRLKKICNK